MDTAKPIKVKAEVMWCFHNKLNEMTNKYSVDLCVAIGNGSKAVVLLSSYEWKYKNKSGVSPSIKKMVIEELQSYDSPEDDGEDDDDVL